MKVTIDFWRVFHLGVLLVGTCGGAQLLEQQLELSTMAAYGLACFCVCQFSNVVIKVCEQRKDTAAVIAAAPIAKNKSGPVEGRKRNHKKKRT